MLFWGGTLSSFSFLGEGNELSFLVAVEGFIGQSRNDHTMPNYREKKGRKIDRYFGIVWSGRTKPEEEKKPSLPQTMGKMESPEPALRGQGS